MTSPFNRRVIDYDLAAVHWRWRRVDLDDVVTEENKGNTSVSWYSDEYAAHAPSGTDLGGGYVLHNWESSALGWPPEEPFPPSLGFGGKDVGFLLREQGFIGGPAPAGTGMTDPTWKLMFQDLILVPLDPEALPADMVSYDFVTEHREIDGGADEDWEWRIYTFGPASSDSASFPYGGNASTGVFPDGVESGWAQHRDAASGYYANNSDALLGTWDQRLIFGPHYHTFVGPAYDYPGGQHQLQLARTWDPPGPEPIVEFAGRHRSQFVRFQ